MNSIWNKNIASFRQRFPQLTQILSEEIENFEKQSISAEQNGTSFVYEIVPSKSGEPTALENNIPLHSKYNPLREAQTLCQQFDNKFSTAVFFSCGLGYAPIEFAKQHKNIPLVIIEPDAFHIFRAFCETDWSPVFSINEVIFLIEASADDAVAFLEHYNIAECKIYSSAPQIKHCEEYYAELSAKLNKHKQKHEINTNTLEKFSHLWLKNSCKNLHYLAELDGVCRYKNLAQLPFVILAAGPSLETILPHLKEIKKRAVIVCVDTALKSCLQSGVEPDFIILVDPQYACFLHMEFLSSPSSILIAESAVYPSVFRFNCKEIILCSSLFPLGQYFEKLLGEKGKLEAGGSVTTTAWDFARYCGAKEIFLAGMDLGFPGRQTHIRGCQFEERTHRTSDKTVTSETGGLSSLFGANVSLSKDYNSNALLTDQRMSLFSWWFETHCKDACASGIKTFTLTSQSLYIEGISPFEIKDFLLREELTVKKKSFFEEGAKRSSVKDISLQKENFNRALSSFLEELEELYNLSKKGISICEKAIADRTKAAAASSQLNEIDSHILSSKGKNAASLVFPTTRQLEQKASSLPQDKVLYPLYYSKLIYTELQCAARQYISLLQKYSS